MKNEKSRLSELYLKISKHSNYQILPKNVEQIIGSNNLLINSRYEKERLDYIKSNINFKNKKVLDIGGNSGYFTFEAINLGARQVVYYEGNYEHSKFVEIVSQKLNINNIGIFNEYYNFEDNEKEKYDIVFLLNVLHHVGDDYGDKEISMDEAKKLMIKQLNSMAKKTNILIFQMGFNWYGNIEKCLFKNGTKKEMTEFIEKNILEKWKIVNIGIAKKVDKNIKYEDINKINFERNDELGEFLNRPIYILKSMV